MKLCGSVLNINFEMNGKKYKSIIRKTQKHSTICEGCVFEKSTPKCEESPQDCAETIGMIYIEDKD